MNPPPPWAAPSNISSLFREIFPDIQPEPPTLTAHIISVYFAVKAFPPILNTFLSSNTGVFFLFVCSCYFVSIFCGFLLLLSFVMLFECQGLKSNRGLFAHGLKAQTHHLSFSFTEGLGRKSPQSPAELGLGMLLLRADLPCSAFRALLLPSAGPSSAATLPAFALPCQRLACSAQREALL